MLFTKTICEMGNGNRIIGSYPQSRNSTITFLGKNNILYCDENVRIVDSFISFSGNNSVIWLSSNRHEYKLAITIFNDSVVYMGKDTFINQKLTIISSERKHCFIGADCMFSLNITIRNADAHLIYSCSTGERINTSKSVYIGDHVWIGQDVRILKGTQIDSGSIIGAMSVVSGKKILHNTSWAGNPCRQLSEDIFWDFSCVHDWTAEKTQDSMNYSDYLSKYKQGCHSDFWIYKHDPLECVEWSELEKHFSADISSMQKCEYLVQLNSQKTKNRFVHR